MESDFRVIPGYYSSKNIFDKIAKCIVEYDKKDNLTLHDLSEIASNCGVEVRRVKNRLWALKLAGWKMKRRQ